MGPTGYRGTIPVDDYYFRGSTFVQKNTRVSINYFSLMCDRNCIGNPGNFASFVYISQPRIYRENNKK